MSTMKRPEIEVVRFKEADVIVASGNIARLSGFNEGGAGTGKVNYGGTDYDYGNRNSLYNQFPSGGTEFFNNNAGEIERIDDLFSNKQNNDLYVSWDGYYKWENEEFVRYRQ